VFDFKMTETEKAIALKELLEKAIKDLKYKNSISIDVFNIKNQFLVVHGFISEDFALGFGELIKNNREYRVTKQNFVILSTNYKILQVHKNLQAYKNRVVTPKP
jgi:hypothetical protein